MDYSELAIIPPLFVFYAIVAKICFVVFPCPEHLLPKNTGNRKTKTYYNYYGNYTSICHAIVSIILTSILLLKEGITMGLPNSYLANFIVYNSLSYFLYDTAISEYYRYNSPAMTIHHLTSIVVMSTVVYLKNSGNEVAHLVALLLAEISNPFNLTRDILKHFKMEGTKVFFYISLTFAGLFIITRFAFIPWQLSVIYPGSTAVAVKILAATVWFISWHWLFVIINLSFKEIRDFLKKSDKKETYWSVLHTFVTHLRRSKIFLASFYLTAGFLSFGTLYLAHFRPKLSAN